MALSREIKFVSDNDLEGKFDGQCRFELNLYSKQQIRDTLGTSGNTLAEVLRSERNPIAEFMEEVLANGPTQASRDPGGWKDYLRRLVLKDCDYDPAKVEATIRRFKNPRTTSIPKMMEPFRELLASRPEAEGEWTKEKLLAVLR